MDKYINVVKELIKYDREEEWFEFKENWFEAHTIGEYISVLSNSAILSGKEYGYLVWGIDDSTHEIVGTIFDFHKDVKKEPLQHYLSRQLTPYINFEFIELYIENKRVVILKIPCAKNIPVAFDGIRYVRMGSSKVSISKYPEKEMLLFETLRNVEKNKLNKTRSDILKEIDKNPKITQEELVKIIGLGKTAIQNNISYLKKNGYIIRQGSNKVGYWIINKGRD